MGPLGLHQISVAESVWVVARSALRLVLSPLRLFVKRLSVGGGVVTSMVPF